MALNNYTDKFISLSNLRKFWTGVSGKIAEVDAKFANYALSTQVASDIASAKSELEGQINGVDAKFAGYTNTEGMNSAISSAVSAQAALDKAAWEAADSAIRTDFASADATLKSELLGEIGKLKTIELSVVESLPAEGASNVIYLVAEDKFSGNYVEWIYVNGAWERIGTTAADLAQYYTKSEIDTKVEGINTAIADAQSGAEATAAAALAEYETEVSNEFSAVRGEITSAVSAAQTTLQGNIDKKLDASAISAYYTSTQVDGFLADKADKSSVYTKGEVDGFISGLGNTYYTETEIDGKVQVLEQAIAKKADSEGLLDNYYTKGEVDSEVKEVADDLAALDETVKGIVSVGGEANVIVGVQVNGADLTVDADRKVNVDLTSYAKSADVYTKTEVDGFVGDLEGAIGDHESAVETWAASIAFATDSEIEGIFA